MERRLLIALFIMLLIYFNYPKVVFEVGDDQIFTCECMGFTYPSGEKKSCIGLPFECRTEYVHHVQRSGFSSARISDVCPRKTCETYEQYLGIYYDDAISTKESVGHLNVIIVMDTSYSMIGEPLVKTIAAATEMINSLGLKDEIGVISFNTYSQIVHELSTDKQSVIAALNRLEAQEHTVYVDALKLAKEQFLSIETPDERDVIVFLSDGEPDDDEHDILETTLELGSMGISIYTIRIGEIDDTEAGDILQRMTNIEGEQGFFTSKDVDTIFDSFDSIVKALVKEDNVFLIDSNLEDEVEYEEDTNVPFLIQLFSSENLRVVPGFVVDDSQVLCVDHADVQAVVKDLEGRMIDNQTMTYVSGQFISELKGIPAGRYVLEAHTTVTFQNDTACRFGDIQQIATIHIVERNGSDCPRKSCHDLSSIITDPRFASPIPGIDSGNRVLFSLDISASMKDENKLFYAKSAITRMVERFGTSFSFGLITFETQSELVQKFTADKAAFSTKLDHLEPKGSTNYIPPLEKAKGMVGTRDFDPATDIAYDTLIFISDGMPWDGGRPGSILDSIDALVERGVCVFTIGYGSEVTPSAEHILKRMAQISVGRLGCGGYFYATPTETDLDRIFGTIYSDISSQGDLLVLPRLNAQQFTHEEKLTMITKIYSGYTGLPLPDGHDSCPIDTRVIVSQMDSDNRSIVDIPLDFAPDFGYHIIGQRVDPEIVSLRLKASIYDDNGTACGMEGIRSIPVRFRESIGDTGRHRFYLRLSSLLINLFLIMVMVYSLIFILQKGDS